MAHERPRGALGAFDEMDTTIAAIEELRREGFDRFTVYSPLPSHDIEHAIDPPQSPVRLFTLVGGLTGTATGFALATWTSVDWPLITGGKPIISLPPFVIIAFELTILFGALSTVLGLFLAARLPARREVLYDPSFSAGRFGIAVDTDDVRGARDIMMRNGAVEVREANPEVNVA